MEKKIFLRFLKEKGIYSFIKREIAKEYKSGIDGFISQNKHILPSAFDSVRVLTFDWGMGAKDCDELKKNRAFWLKLNYEWKEYYFRETHKINNN